MFMIRWCKKKFFGMGLGTAFEDLENLGEI